MRHGIGAALLALGWSLALGGSTDAPLEQPADESSGWEQRALADTGPGPFLVLLEQVRVLRIELLDLRIERCDERIQDLDARLRKLAVEIDETERDLDHVRGELDRNDEELIDADVDGPQYRYLEAMQQVLESGRADELDARSERLGAEEDELRGELKRRRRERERLVRELEALAGRA